MPLALFNSTASQRLALSSVVSQWFGFHQQQKEGKAHPYYRPNSNVVTFRASMLFALNAGTLSFKIAGAFALENPVHPSLWTRIFSHHLVCFFES